MRRCKMSINLVSWISRSTTITPIIFLFRIRFLSMIRVPFRKAAIRIVFIGMFMTRGIELSILGVQGWTEERSWIRLTRQMIRVPIPDSLTQLPSTESTIQLQSKDQMTQGQSSKQITQGLFTEPETQTTGHTTKKLKIELRKPAIGKN